MSEPYAGRAAESAARAKANRGMKTAKQHNAGVVGEGEGMTAEYVLLPCPFCGGEAAIKRRGTYRASMVIGCENCGCDIESGDVAGLTSSANLRWNHRHAPDLARLKAERDELREALQQIMDARSRTATEVNNAIERASAILKRTEPK